MNHLQVEEDDYKNVGLRPRHAYSVLDVKDLSGIKLLRLRNPWGHFSWKGTWSDKSDIWTKELREDLMRKSFYATLHFCWFVFEVIVYLMGFEFI